MILDKGAKMDKGQSFQKILLGKLDRVSGQFPSTKSPNYFSKLHWNLQRFH